MCYKYDSLLEVSHISSHVSRAVRCTFFIELLHTVHMVLTRKLMMYNENNSCDEWGLDGACGNNGILKIPEEDQKNL